MTSALGPLGEPWQPRAEVLTIGAKTKGKRTDRRQRKWMLTGARRKARAKGKTGLRKTASTVTGK